MSQKRELAVEQGAHDVYQQWPTKDHFQSAIGKHMHQWVNTFIHNLFIDIIRHAHTQANPSAMVIDHNVP